MDQFVLYHFAIMKNDRVYKIDVQPNAPWDELQAVLDEFKQEFAAMQAAAVAKQAEQQPVESA